MPKKHYICSDANTMQIALVNEDYDDVVVAVVYFGDSRFSLKSGTSNTQRAIYRHIQSNREYVKDANGISHSIAQILDITEQKHLEAQLHKAQKIESLGSF